MTGSNFCFLVLDGVAKWGKNTSTLYLSAYLNDDLFRVKVYGYSMILHTTHISLIFRRHNKWQVQLVNIRCHTKVMVSNKVSKGV